MMRLVAAGGPIAYLGCLRLGALGQHFQGCLCGFAEKGEHRIKRQLDIMSNIAAKLERYRNPWQELKLQYGANKGKAYTGAPHSLSTPNPTEWQRSQHPLHTLA